MKPKVKIIMFISLVAKVYRILNAKNNTGKHPSEILFSFRKRNEQLSVKISRHVLIISGIIISLITTLFCALVGNKWTNILFLHEKERCEKVTFGYTCTKVIEKRAKERQFTPPNESWFIKQETPYDIFYILRMTKIDLIHHKGKIHQ